MEKENSKFIYPNIEFCSSTLLKTMHAVMVTYVPEYASEITGYLS